MAKKYIGVDVGGTSIKLGIVDDRGEVLIKKESIYTLSRSSYRLTSSVVG